jgi:hypothetical protein
LVRAFLRSLLYCTYGHHGCRYVGIRVLCLPITDRVSSGLLSCHNLTSVSIQGQLLRSSYVDTCTCLHTVRALLTPHVNSVQYSIRTYHLYGRWTIKKCRNEAPAVILQYQTVVVHRPKTKPNIIPSSHSHHPPASRNTGAMLLAANRFHCTSLACCC